MITAIIQARLNSTRLPRKVLLPFPYPPRTILDAVISQAKLSLVDEVILAIPGRDLDLLNNFCKTSIWGGDENDLVNRYYMAACENNADPIVRITADCPLILPEVIDYVIKEYFRSECDYVYNRCDDSPGNWPDGLDVEVFSFSALQAAYVLAEWREDMTWIRENRTSWQVRPDRDYGECTSINTKEDYEKALLILGGRQNGSSTKRG